MKKQKKTGRRFVQRVKVKKLEGIGMSLPEDEVNRPTGTRQPTSVAVFTCPLCGATIMHLEMLEETMEHG